MKAKIKIRMEVLLKGAGSACKATIDVIKYLESKEEKE